jgi:general secretion pathway protein H
VRAPGFTLIELLVVVAIVAIASAVATLALRDGDATRLEEDAARLSALLESARAQARAAGLAARWEPHRSGDTMPEGADFRFVGLASSDAQPSRWLHGGVSAEVVGASVVVLGPEPIIGAQRIVLRLAQRSLTLTTDGLAPFAVAAGDTGAP